MNMALFKQSTNSPQGIPCGLRDTRHAHSLPTASRGAAKLPNSVTETDDYDEDFLTAFPLQQSWRGEGELGGVSTRPSEVLVVSEHSG